MSLTVLRHPLSRHLIDTLRDVNTDPASFRTYARTLTTMLVLAATEPIALESKSVQTPLETTEGSFLGQAVAVVPVLRAGLSMLEPVVELFPDVAVGYIGLERSHETAIAHSYYCKLPRLDGRFTICCDPMLATGGSASQAISLLKSHGAKQVTMVSMIASPQGVARVETDHPDVPIFTAALDRGLNERKYIVPGLGDFGDRLYGTL